MKHINEVLKTKKTKSYLSGIRNKKADRRKKQTKNKGK